MSEQDRLLPIANVARIMKRGIPESAKISKDAKECVQECVSEFIAFVTSEAMDRCAMEKRKTINAEDVLWALNSLGFESYSDTLNVYLSKHREKKVESELNVQDITQLLVQQHQLATSLQPAQKE